VPASKLAILVAVFFVTSVISIVTGSTSLITVPVMIAFGVEPHVAVATNMMALIFMSVGGSLPFARKGVVENNIGNEGGGYQFIFSPTLSPVHLWAAYAALKRRSSTVLSGFRGTLQTAGLSTSLALPTESILFVEFLSKILRRILAPALAGDVA
jgi:hypothetical protein